MLPRFKKFLLKLWHKAFCEDIARVKILFFLRNIGGHSNCLPDMSSCRHHPRRRKSHMRSADKSPPQKQILNILAIQATVRDLVNTFGMPLVTARFLAKDTNGGMQVDRPSTISHSIVMLTLFDNILLAQHIVSLKTTALAFSRNRTYPFQRHGFRFGKIARVLDIIPCSIDHFPQIPFNLFGIVYGIHPPTMLQPPKLAAVLFRIEFSKLRHFLSNIQCKCRCFIFHWTSGILRIEIHAMPQKLTIFLGRCKFFSKFLFFLCPHSKCSTRKKTHNTV